MKLQQLLETFNYQIEGGSDYGWDCYPNARHLDFHSAHGDASVLFCSKTQLVYECTIDSPKAKHVYRWVNPDYKEAMLSEAKKRKCPPDHAWDDTKWIDLETPSDFLQKAKAIFDGKEVDPRIEMVLNIDNDVLFKVALMAHERDITLNKMLEEILTWWKDNEQKDKQETKD